jgi:HlyD family secretion protein
MRTIVVALLVIGVPVGGMFAYKRYFSTTPPPKYRTATVTRGDLYPIIKATGTVEPEEVVDVGAQVAGRIKELGIDHEAEKRIRNVRERDVVRKFPKIEGATKPEPREDALESNQEAADAAKTGEPAERPRKVSEGPQAPPASEGRGVMATAFEIPAKAAVADPDSAEAPQAAAGPLGTSAPLAGSETSEGGSISAGTPKPATKRPLIDYGSIVHEGTVLARIDDSVYKAQVEQAQAALERSRADLGQLEAKAEQAAAELRRAERLRAVQGISDPLNQRPIKAISDSDFDLALANDKVARANLEVGKAQVKQNQAALALAKTNFNYTVISSPVEGVIIARRVNIGQTVVAALNAPSLFLIAKDLKRIQVWASVNEADIGRIQVGMKVKFTVDAHPDEVFEGRVIQVRLNATMTQNVVTYTVVVGTDNPDGKLLPYLTANLQFQVDELHGVLRVPNAALRYKPRPTQIAPDARQKAGAGKTGKEGDKSQAAAKTEEETEKTADDAAKTPGDAAKSGEPSAKRLAEAAPSRRGPAKGAGPGPGKAGKKQQERGRLWVKDAETAFLRPVEVKIGPSDDSLTEVSGPELKEGMEVIVGEEVADQGPSDVENPFAPKLFKGKKR